MTLAEMLTAYEQLYTSPSLDRPERVERERHRVREALLKKLDDTEAEVRRLRLDNDVLTGRLRAAEAKLARVEALLKRGVSPILPLADQDSAYRSGWRAAVNTLTAALHDALRGEP